MHASLVIVGAGQAAAQAVISLRQHGYAGSIVLVGEERHPPYQRPPLSKKYLAGQLAEERLYLKPLRYYAEHGVELRLGRRALALDVQQRRVRLDDGQEIEFDHALLTLGSHARRLDVPGAELRGIHYLRSLDDVAAIRPQFTRGTRLVVAGGGYIGLEVAAVARACGLIVHVVEAAGRIMQRVVGEPVSEFYQRLHAEAGVHIHLGAAVRGFEGRDRVRAVVTGTGETIAADLVVTGVGVLPTTGLAEQAGLACRDGILVDEHAVTSDPQVLAAGDCTRHPNEIFGGDLRLESVHNALEQARTAAATLCGEARPYAQVPWFWSDQYDIKLQTAGLARDHDRIVVRGDPSSHRFSACYLRAGRLLAVDAVNQPHDFIQGRVLIGERAQMDPERLADERLPLQETRLP